MAVLGLEATAHYAQFVQIFNKKKVFQFQLNFKYPKLDTLLNIKVNIRDAFVCFKT